jgi:alkanesulfonate monooxygenase SsuD/methylene tetrahydromethanopterin reductase-like flavin-dependent oxidoreductase (luciferase family)
MTLPQFETGATLMITGAQMAEELGFSGVFAFDHLLPIVDPWRPVLECAASLGAVAAATTRVRVGTLVMRTAIRGPEATAAVGATLQALAPGRSVLGLGVGDRKSDQEAERFGMPLADLRSRLTETESAIRLARGICPQLPIWVGGRHPALRELANEAADGWNVWGVTPEVFAKEGRGVRIKRTWGGAVLIAPDNQTLANLIARRGGTEGVVAGTPEVVCSSLNELVAAGAEELVVSVVPKRPATWKLFAAEVLPRLT